MPALLPEEKKKLPIRPNIQQANKAALGSLKGFGSSVMDKASSALAYPGQVVKRTFNQVARGVENLPQTLKDFDAKRGQEMRADLDQSALEGKSPFPTPLNNQAIRAKSAQDKIAQITPNVQGGLTPGTPEFDADIARFRKGTDELNADIDAREAANPNLAQTKPVGELVKQPTRPASPEISGEIPEGNILTLDGSRPREEVLPDNSFNKANTENYFNQTGYIKDNDPRMVKRRAEAEEVQQRRLDFINGNKPKTLGTRKLEAGEREATADRTSAEQIARLNRESNVTEAQQLAGAKRAELKQKRDIATEKLTGTPKGIYANLFKIPGYMNLATTIDELPFDSPERADLIKKFDEIEGGLNYSSYAALKERIAR